MSDEFNGRCLLPKLHLGQLFHGSGLRDESDLCPLIVTSRDFGNVYLDGRTRYLGEMWEIHHRYVRCRKLTARQIDVVTTSG